MFPAETNDGKKQLWIRRLDSGATQPIPGTEDAFLPFWSPDSRWVGFGQANTLKKIDVNAGPAVSIVGNLKTPIRGASWSPDGVIVFSTNAPGPLLRVSAAGGTPSPATTFEKDHDTPLHRFPWFLPDGRHFLYISSQLGDMQVRVGSLDEAGQPGKVVTRAHSPAIYAKGYLLYLRERTLMAQQFDTEQLAVTGDPVPLAERVHTTMQPSRLGLFTVSSSGMLSYLSTPSPGRSKVAWRDRGGNELSVVGDNSLAVGLALSPDGASLAVELAALPTYDVWVYDVARGGRTRLTFDGASGSPVWSHDGRAIFLARASNGIEDIFWKPVDGSGMDELVYASPVSEVVSSISPDGRFLLYTATAGQSPSSILVLPLNDQYRAGPSEPRLFLQQGQFQIDQGAFSPDGQWVAYVSNESGANEVYAVRFPTGAARRRISSTGGTYPRWRRDGRELFYLSPRGEMMAAAVSVRAETLDVSGTKALFGGLDRTALYDVSGDGQKFIVSQEVTTTAVQPLTLIQNWTAMLKR